MLLGMTIGANHPLYLNLLLLLAIGLVTRIPRVESGTPLPSSQPSSPLLSGLPPVTSTSQIPGEEYNYAAKKMTPLPALTTYRAHMMLMTVLAILAVDFPVFPRSLVKCETFGVSLVRPKDSVEDKVDRVYRWILE